MGALAQRMGMLALLLAAVCLTGALVAIAAPPLAPLSSVGHLRPAPAPGTLGPEGVPIPKGKLLGPVQEVKLGETIDGVTCQAREVVAYHIHAHLTIFVSGRSYVIPYGIGIGPPLAGVQTPAGPFVVEGSCFMWLHTHASDGIIHIESPTSRTYTLGQFFKVWGQPLTRSEVGPAKGKVTAFYNDKVWTAPLGRIPLTARAQIQLDVGAPLIAPEHIRFPVGLAGSMSNSGTK